MSNFCALLEVFKSSSNYDHALEVYNSLTDEEKKFVAPNGLKDIPGFKYITYKHREPAAFIFIHDFYKDNSAGFITMAVKKEYRRNELAMYLLKVAMNYFKRSSFKELIFRCDSNNIASYKLAKKFGFKLKSVAVDKLTFAISK